MDRLIVQVLATYALWFIITQSTLPVWSPLRDRLAERWPTFGHFLMCPVCSGFWCSLAVAVAAVAPTALEVAPLRDVALLALVGTAGCYLIETHVTRLQAK